MEVKEIRLSEIDCKVIYQIRPLNENSLSYQKLKFAIEKDGQRNPITVRELTDDEKAQTDEGKLYGVIDGHHRFAIVSELGQNVILAEIDERNNDSDQKYQDIVLAYRLNESSIKMSPLEKGKVIYELTCTINKDISQIGEEIFGLKSYVL